MRPASTPFHVLLILAVLLTQACQRSPSQDSLAAGAPDLVQLLHVVEARADSLRRWVGGDTTVGQAAVERGVDRDVAVLALTRRLRDATAEWLATASGTDSLADGSRFAALADSVITMQGRRIERRLQRALREVPEVPGLCDRSPASWYCRVQNVYRSRHLTPRMAVALDTLRTLGQTVEQWGTDEQEQYWKDTGWLAGYYRQYLIRRGLVTREWVEWDEERQRGVITPAGRERERLADSIAAALRVAGCRGCWAVATGSDYTTLRVLDSRAEDMLNDYRSAPLRLWEAGFTEVEYLFGPGRVYAIHRRSPDR